MPSCLSERARPAAAAGRCPGEEGPGHFGPLPPALHQGPRPSVCSDVVGAVFCALRTPPLPFLLPAPGSAKSAKFLPELALTSPPGAVRKPTRRPPPAWGRDGGSGTAPVQKHRH